MSTRPLRIAQAERSPLDLGRGEVNRGAARPLYAPTAVAPGDNRTRPSGKLRSMSPLQTPPSVRGCRTCWTPQPSLKGWHARLYRQPPVFRTGSRAPPCPSGAGGNCPVGSNSMGAAVRVNTGRRRAACGTMSVRAVRRLTSSTRTTAPHRRVRDAGLNPRRSVWPSRCVR
jgi:hypothetical protein